MRDESANNLNDHGNYPETQIDSNEVTREMKIEFVGRIKKLSNAGLTSLVEKVKEVKA